MSHWLGIVASGCYQNSVEDYYVRLFPSGKASYALGSSPALTCYAVGTDVLHRPVWCKETGYDCVVLDSDENTNSDLFNITYSFAESNCTWISHLEMKSFSASESVTYNCYIAGTNAGDNVTINLVEDTSAAGWLCNYDC